MASYGHNYVGPVNKAIEPLGECRTDFQMFSSLASRFSFADQFCQPAEEWLEKVCAPIVESGCSMAALRKGPFRLPEPMAPYLDKQFATPSGRFQFMTEFDPAAMTGEYADYPYCLLTIAGKDHICSERTIAEHSPLPEVWLHPDEAKNCGIQEGDRVEVHSAVGQITARLGLDATLRKDCLLAERGGWLKAGHGLNRLTADIASTVGEGTPYYETRVKVLPCLE